MPNCIKLNLAKWTVLIAGLALAAGCQDVGQIMAPSDAQRGPAEAPEVVANQPAPIADVAEVPSVHVPESINPYVTEVLNTESDPETVDDFPIVEPSYSLEELLAAADSILDEELGSVEEVAIDNVGQEQVAETTVVSLPEDGIAELFDKQENLDAPDQQEVLAENVVEPSTVMPGETAKESEEATASLVNEGLVSIVNEVAGPIEVAEPIESMVKEEPETQELADVAVETPLETTEDASVQEVAGQSGTEVGNGMHIEQPVLAESNGLSDEQDFEAVSSRETIETDAERLQAQREQLLVFEPTDLPEQKGRASVARYAIESKHEVGTKMHRRFGILVSQSRLALRCKEYGSPDIAQQAFLDAGGPEKDELNLDPDGDGFVCGWSPDPYRRLLQ